MLAQTRGDAEHNASRDVSNRLALALIGPFDVHRCSSLAADKLYWLRTAFLDVARGVPCLL